MSRRSTIETKLSKETLQELNNKLQENGFGNYTGLTQWLNEQGYDVKRSAVHRYGQKLSQIASTEEEMELLNIFRQLEPNTRFSVLDFARFQLTQK